MNVVKVPNYQEKPEKERANRFGDLGENPLKRAIVGADSGVGQDTGDRAD